MQNLTAKTRAVIVRVKAQKRTQKTSKRGRQRHKKKTKTLIFCSRKPPPKLILAESNWGKRRRLKHPVEESNISSHSCKGNWFLHTLTSQWTIYHSRGQLSFLQTLNQHLMLLVSLLSPLMHCRPLIQSRCLKICQRRWRPHPPQ